MKKRGTCKAKRKKKEKKKVYYHLVSCGMQLPLGNQLLPSPKVPKCDAEPCFLGTWGDGCVGWMGSPCAILNFSHHETHLDLNSFKMDLMSTEKLKYKWIKCKMGDQATCTLLDCGTSCINFLSYYSFATKLYRFNGCNQTTRPTTHNCLSESVCMMQCLCDISVMQAWCCLIHKLIYLIRAVILWCSQSGEMILARRRVFISSFFPLYYIISPFVLIPSFVEIGILILNFMDFTYSFTR